MIKLQKIEEASQEVRDKIAQGNTDLGVFNPLRAALEIARKEIANIEVKDVDGMTADDVKEYRALRANLNKVLGFVKDRRMDITRKLDELKKGFIAAEKEMVDGIAEKGDELKKAINAKSEQIKMEERRRELPRRKEQMETLAFIPKLCDNDILAMDDKQWGEWLVSAVKRNEEERNRQIEQKAREEQIRREAEERARREERERMRREQEDKERAEREAKERAEAEREKQLSNAEFQKWLVENKYNKNTDILKRDGNKINLYRKIATYGN